MRKLLVLLGIIVVLIGIAVGGLLFVLQDANRFKPELEALIAENSGYQVQLNGDLSWGLWPPISLHAADVSFADEATRYELASLNAKVALQSALSGAIVVQQVVLTDLLMTDLTTQSITRVNRLTLDGFAPGVPTPMRADVTLVNTPEPDSNLLVDAVMTVDLERDAMTLADLNFDYDGTQGTCQVDVTHLNRKPVRPSPSNPDDVLPLSTFRAMDWVADCVIPEYATETTSIANIKLKSNNTSARSNTKIEVPDFFGGDLALNAAIDTRPESPHWVITPDAENLQSQQIMAVLSPKLAWIAPLLMGGKFTLRGNTLPELTNSVSGNINLSANEGSLDISLLRDSIVQIGELLGEPTGVEDWPDVLSYDLFKGDWQVDGHNHDLDFAFDNLLVRADGDYDPLTDDLDMAASLTINEHASLSGLDINPVLYGLPIPMRCTGTMTAPSCGFDANAAQDTLKQLAANKARAAADSKVDELLEEKVPEEYRDAARDLLKGLLGGDKND